MARGSMLSSFKGFDAFGKTMEDVKIKTRTGALLTMISAALIFSFTLMEFVDYRRVYTDTSVVVDRSRGEKLLVTMNITFPKVPCYLLSLDVMDISGDYQTDLHHDIVKTRLAENGARIDDGIINADPSLSYNSLPRNSRRNNRVKPYQSEHHQQPAKPVHTPKMNNNLNNVSIPPTPMDRRITQRTTPLVVPRANGARANVPLYSNPHGHGRPIGMRYIDYTVPTPTVIPNPFMPFPDQMGRHPPSPPHRLQTTVHTVSPASTSTPGEIDEQFSSNYTVDEILYSETPHGEPGPDGHPSHDDEHHEWGHMIRHLLQPDYGHDDDGAATSDNDDTLAPEIVDDSASSNANSDSHSQHDDAAHQTSHQLAHALDPNAHHSSDKHDDAAHDDAHKMAHVLDPNAHHASDDHSTHGHQSDGHTNHNDQQHADSHNLAHVLDPNAHHSSDNHNDASHDAAHKMAHVLDPNAHHASDDHSTHGDESNGHTDHNDQQHADSHKLAHVLDPNAHHSSDNHNDAAHDASHKMSHILNPDAHHASDDHNSPDDHSDKSHDDSHKLAHIVDPNAHHSSDNHNDAAHDESHKLSHVLDPNSHHTSDPPEPIARGSTALKNELDKTAAKRGPDYCGSCYGGIEPEAGCCNTCEAVRQAYLARGWSFGNPDAVEQCADEHWTEHIHEQASEGCNIAGKITVNKVIGNFHLSPGRSFLTNSQNVHNLVPYLKDENTHTFGHIIHEFAFENEGHRDREHLTKELRRRLGIVYNPLDTTGSFHPNKENMYQYFLKVVGTQYHFLDQTVGSTHQYSVTTYERDLSTGSNQEKGPDGIVTTHGVTGMPGVFFNFEISPMKVVHQERRQSFAHFLTSMCAIVGGVLTVASLLDSILFRTHKVIKKGANAVAQENKMAQERPGLLQRPSAFGSTIKMS